MITILKISICVVISYSLLATTYIGLSKVATLVLYTIQILLAAALSRILLLIFSDGISSQEIPIILFIVIVSIMIRISQSFIKTNKGKWKHAEFFNVDANG